MDITGYKWYTDYIDLNDADKFDKMYLAAELFFATDPAYNITNLAPEQGAEILSCYTQVRLLGRAWQKRIEDFGVVKAGVFAVIDQEKIDLLQAHDDKVIAEGALWSEKELNGYDVDYVIPV